MNKLPVAKRAQILGMMVEGVSIRAISRMTGASKNTIVKLLADAGQVCSEYQDRTLVNLPCKRLQADEIWSLVYAKQKNVPQEMRGKFGVGDVWTWTALCADTKLVPSWYVGTRDADAAYRFMSDLAGRLANRVQLTTDGHRAYLSPVDAAFDRAIDYAMLVKHYGIAPEAEKRYSPPVCVERQNLSMRMGIRRFTRLTNAFSKKLENHIHALSIYFMHYNFVRIHQTLRCTPAMEAKVTTKLWSLEDMVTLVDEWKPLRRMKIQTDPLPDHQQVSTRSSRSANISNSPHTASSPASPSLLVPRMCAESRDNSAVR